MSERTSAYENTHFDLRGKVAVVTGGRQGLGLDIAEALAEAGCDVAITSRDARSAEEAAAALRRVYGIDALTVGIDVRDIASVARASGEVWAWKRRLDIVVNNAGGGSGLSAGDLFDRQVEDIKHLLDVNLLGTLLCCREFCRPMLAPRAGRVINIVSIAGLVGRDRHIYEANGVNEQPVDYAAAKGGVLALTRDLAAKLAPYRINVNAISPGGFDRGHLPPGFVSEYSDKTMAGRMGVMGRDLKGAVQFLASAASEYVTGQNLVVDGGFVTYK